MRGWIVVFGKAPRVGQVKTRLTPRLSPEQAATFYACLLDDVLEVTTQAARGLQLEPLLAVHPPQALGELARRAPAGLRVVAQRGPNLAGRMAHALAQAAAANAWPVLLRGSDSPALDAATLGSAVAALESADLVLCPDRDGGYNLVGLRRPAPGLFEHPMSTTAVLSDTLVHAARLGLRVHLLPTGFDIDTFEDLRWLAEARRAGGGLRCRRTLAFLDQNGLWPERHAAADGTLSRR